MAQVLWQLDLHDLPAAVRSGPCDEAVRVAVGRLRLQCASTLLGFGSGHDVMVRRSRPRATTSCARPEPYDEGMRVHGDVDIDALPGADLVAEGIADAEHGRDTIAAALTRMASPRLRALGIDAPHPGEGPPPGHRLYELLAPDVARAAERAQSG